MFFQSVHQISATNKKRSGMAKAQMSGFNVMRWLHQDGKRVDRGFSAYSWRWRGGGRENTYANTKYYLSISLIVCEMFRRPVVLLKCPKSSKNQRVHRTTIISNQFNFQYKRKSLDNLRAKWYSRSNDVPLNWETRVHFFFRCGEFFVLLSLNLSSPLSPWIVFIFYLLGRSVLSAS